ncbi:MULTISPECIES: hypothetical protein [Clostridium]|uniref:Uncharacterized protein n=3 Tax=Clostridium TaxID=1485 RepID=A0A6V8SLQ4_9CLOT|nr:MULTISPECIES: hypothetical protein [Clostridium]GFP78107.1 hypothetical protein bsdtw1_04301 [Clostridium fungisolvens]GFZ33511.1 hypothetical protein CSC2_40370 [Clostridium zeae]GKU25979.1 hypothetical protein CFOLD11_28060 [Clostridium folliculivorans]GKU28065.1 hypothetical protein CFB3_01710 [Clostridium folliculivorans]
MNTYVAELNCAQLKQLVEFFDNYQDDNIKCTIKENVSKIKATMDVETSLPKDKLESYLKTTFKNKSKFGMALYFAIYVK